MPLMNGINLFQTFVTLVVIKFFAMYCQSLSDLLKGNSSILVTHSE